MENILSLGQKELIDNLFHNSLVLREATLPLPIPTFRKKVFTFFINKGCLLAGSFKFSGKLREPIILNINLAKNLRIPRVESLRLEPLPLSERQIRAFHRRLFTIYCPIGVVVLLISYRWTRHLLGVEKCRDIERQLEELIEYLKAKYGKLWYRILIFLLIALSIGIPIWAYLRDFGYFKILLYLNSFNSNSTLAEEAIMAELHDLLEKNNLEEILRFSKMVSKLNLDSLAPFTRQAILQLRALLLRQGYKLS